MKNELFSLRACALYFISVGAIAFASMAASQDEKRFSANVVDMSVTSLLDLIGQEFGIEFTGAISPRHRVSGLALDGSQDDVLSAVIDAARLDAFRFNGQTYVSLAEERAVRLVVLDDVDSTTAIDALASAGLLFSDFEVAEVANGGALVMSGPVQYLALSEGVIDALALEPEETPQSVLVRRGVQSAFGGASVSPDAVNTN